MIDILLCYEQGTYSGKVSNEDFAYLTGCPRYVGTCTDEEAFLEALVKRLDKVVPPCFCPEPIHFMRYDID